MVNKLTFNISIKHHCPVVDFFSNYFNYNNTRYTVISKNDLVITVKEEEEETTYKKTALKVISLFSGIVPLFAFIFLAFQFQKFNLYKDIEFTLLSSQTDRIAKKLLIDPSPTFIIEKIEVEETEDVDKLLTLSLNYAYGAGVKKNNIKAAEFLEKAADLGSELAKLINYFYCPVEQRTENFNTTRLQDIESFYKNNPLAMMKLGQFYIEESDWDKGIAFLINAAENHHFWCASLELGLAYLKNKESQKAIKEFLKLIDLDLDSETFLYLGNKLTALKEPIGLLFVELSLQKTEASLYLDKFKEKS